MSAALVEELKSLPVNDRLDLVELLWDSIAAEPESLPLSDEQMRRHLTEFASRAFRRPAQVEEIDRFLQLIATRRQVGRSALEAYGDGLKAVLCSPAFLYLDEPGDKRLSSYALASRLSYFLWSSLPDEELLELASDGSTLRLRGWRSTRRRARPMELRQLPEHVAKRAIAESRKWKMNDFCRVVQQLAELLEPFELV